MTKKKETARALLFSFTGPIKFSPAVLPQIESAAEKYFDQLSHFHASLGMPWPSRLELKLPDGTRVIFSRPKSEGPPPTKRQKEILREMTKPTLLRLEFFESIASIAGTEADRENIKIKKEQYENAVFGTLNEKRKRAGAGFLMDLRSAELYHRESPNPGLSVIARIRVAYATPLFQALIENNTEFMQGVLEKMRRSASHWHEDPTKKWLIEHEEEIKSFTPPKIMERFGSEFPCKSVNKLREKLNEVRVQHKHDPRGRGSPTYRFGKGWGQLKASLSQ